MSGMRGRLLYESFLCHHFSFSFINPNFRKAIFKGRFKDQLHLYYHSGWFVLTVCSVPYSRQKLNLPLPPRAHTLKICSERELNWETQRRSSRGYYFLFYSFKTHLLLKRDLLCKKASCLGKHLPCISAQTLIPAHQKGMSTDDLFFLILLSPDNFCLFPWHAGEGTLELCNFSI